MFCLKLHLWYLAALAFGRYLHGSIVVAVLLLDPNCSHAVLVALRCSRLLRHYLRPVLPLENQDFRNSKDVNFCKIPRFSKFQDLKQIPANIPERDRLRGNFRYGLN